MAAEKLTHQIFLDITSSAQLWQKNPFSPEKPACANFVRAGAAAGFKGSTLKNPKRHTNHHHTAQTTEIN